MQKPFIYDNSGGKIVITPITTSAGTADGGKIPVTKSTGKFDESLLPFTFPSSSTDNAICRFDGVTGKSVQSSLCSIDDNGRIVIGSNTFSSSFPCQLEVINSSDYSVAKFGNHCPVYFRDWYPSIDFNLYNDGSWKFAHEINTSTAYYGSLISFNVSSGIMNFYLSSASGISGATATLVNLFNLSYTGVYSFGHGTQNILVFPAVGVSAPSFATRSVGTKLILYPNISASTVDYALGIEGSCLWASVPNSAYLYKWYFGTTARSQFGYEVSYLTAGLELGLLGYSGDRNCAIDFHSDDTYTDFGLRILKSAGANGSTFIQHRGTGYFYIQANEAATVEFRTNSTNRYQIDGNGYHYPQYRGYPAMASYVIRHSSTEVTYYSSSRKLKKNIVDMEFDTSLLYKLRTVNFYPYDKEEVEENKEVGFIAEEVAEIHPKFATYDDKKEPNGISWFLLVTLLVAEIKNINKRIEVLESGNKKRNRNRE